MRVAVKKLPNLGADQPSGEAMHAALLREIELASKFSSDRWAVDVCRSCAGDWPGVRGKRQRARPPGLGALHRTWLDALCGPAPLLGLAALDEAQPAPACAPCWSRLVKVYGACTADREHICLIMELMEGGCWDGGSLLLFIAPR